MPLRLLRHGEIGTGRRIRAVASVSVLAVLTVALAGLAAASLPPVRSPSGAAFLTVDAPVPATVSESAVSERQVALALQAAGALSGPLPGRERPALRFGASPDLPMPGLPAPEASAPAATPAGPSTEIAPAVAAEPRSEAEFVESPRPPPVASERAAGRGIEPSVTAALPHRAAIVAALPHAIGLRHRPGVVAAKPRLVAVASRGAKVPAAPPTAGLETAWTLPGALAPTGP